MVNHTVGFSLDHKDNTSYSLDQSSKDAQTSSRAFTDEKFQGILNLLNENKQSPTHVANSVVNTTPPALPAPSVHIEPNLMLGLGNMPSLVIRKAQKATYYMIWSHNIFLSRDSIFYEDTFSFLNLDPSLITHNTSNPSSIPLPSYTPPTPDTDTIISPNPIPEPTPTITTPPTTRQFLRNRRPHSYLQDYQCDLAITSQRPINTSSSTSHPLSSIISYRNCSASYKNFCLSITANKEPQSYAQASKIPYWQDAMQKELQALTFNDTWSLTDLPKHKHPIGCKWVYKTKFHAAGSLERHKARLVSKCYTQMEGIDYFETFSPIVKITTVRIVLALAFAKAWFMEQLDINNAFLHGDLHEEIYMLPPPSLSLPKLNMVCKLHKSLYGLKHASKEWHTTLSNKLLSLGFLHS
ncbi:PREDICTED: uncharacterized protein LOC109335406 [Lupinus angustifolius]|uniref:uncharacterized protein LOC109335406 n=1 Tax=Lupinus angustifolius TaxID=3871 RepID=UPI00092E660B|nr:PREDICTED: uncharacterized protein LOC109335406 [Lupinus angustifolius]